MALRAGRASRLRRAARGRAGFVALACGLYLAAGLAATWPALEEARTSFLAAGGDGRGAVAPGDHLQSAYNLWLPGHQLEQGQAPWLDPYSFQPEAEPRVNFAGWPFGLAFWPLWHLFGTVGAWNAFVLLAYVGAGGLACLWLRELGLPRGAALAGGLAFALAPYLQVQSSAGHMLAPVSMLLPLALWAYERARRGSTAWLGLAAAALASIPLSGQVHLALGAIPFFLVYAVCRSRAPRLLLGTLAVAALAVVAGLLVYVVSIRGSIGAAGRSFAQVERYSASLTDFFSRERNGELERYVFLGWATPAAALAGLALLRNRLALALGLGALVPIMLALGANLPGYEAIWRNVPGLRETRVPERLLPVACLAVAALVGFALARVRRHAALVLVLALLFVDLRIGPYRPTAADERNEAFTVLRSQAPGILLDVPPFPPDRQEASIYLYYTMQAPRERVGGYSTTASKQAARVLRELRSLHCGGHLEPSRLSSLGIRYVAFHQGRMHDPSCGWTTIGNLLTGRTFGELASTEHVLLLGPPP